MSNFIRRHLSLSFAQISTPFPSGVLHHDSLAAFHRCLVAVPGDMMDEVCETSNDSFRVKERTTFPCQTGWVTFDEPDKESRVIECPAEEKPSEENGRYLSLLGKFDIKAYMVS